MNNCHINIALLEPSAIISEGISSILSQQARHYQYFHFDSFDELTDNLLENKLDLILLNPVYIQNNKVDFIQKKSLFHSVFWVGIVYSFFERNTLNLLDGIIQISDPAEIIYSTIEQLTHSKCHCGTKTCNEQLTKREIDVLKEISLGRSNKEIADDLIISIHTVTSHRKNIIKKTGIKSQAGLTIYAIENKIISVEDYVD